MAFVPGYEHDVFVSYAHGDNREWVGRFVDRLRSKLNEKLGDSAEVWLDETKLRATRDFRQEIPIVSRGQRFFFYFHPYIPALAILRGNRVSGVR